MEKIYDYAEDKNLRNYVLFVDDDFVYFDADKTFKVTDEELKHMILKGSLINIDGEYVKPFKIKHVEPVGAIAYEEISYMYQGQIKVARSTNIDVTNLKELVEQLKLRIISIEAQNSEHENLFKVLVGLENRLKGLKNE